MSPRTIVAGPLGGWMVMQDIEGGLWLYGVDHKEGVELPKGKTLTEFSHGAPQSRTTLTRIGAGALVAGPLGAVVGAGVRKDKSKVYGTVVAPGVTALIEVPATKESALRNFLRIINDPPAPLTREQMVAKHKSNAVVGSIGMGVVVVLIGLVVAWACGAFKGAPERTFGDLGSYTVGEDIVPGTYKIVPNWRDPKLCSWTISADINGHEMEIATRKGTMVTLTEGQIISSDWCGEWKLA